MTQTGAIRKPGRNRFAGCLLVLVLLLILLGVGGGLVATQLQPPDVIGLQVRINAPQSGEMAEVNRPVSVDASASYAAGLTRLELYVDGALVAVQQLQATNPSALNLARDWSPRNAGRHILVARAYGVDNTKADSPIAYLDVVNLVDPTVHVTPQDIPQIPDTTHPSLNQLSQGLNIPLTELQRANPGLSGTNPNAPLPPDTPLDLPRSPAPPPAPGTPEFTPSGDDPGAVPPVPLPGTPTAPTSLNVVADCTYAQLTWADSPDEEQYVIYRLGPSDVALNSMATLPQNSTSFRETLSEPGVYRYQVAAVRGGLEGATPMAAANTPDSCVPPAPVPGTANLMLTLITLQTDTPQDHAYCYLSVDGATYERVPAGDFAYLTADSSDARHLRYNLGRQPAGLAPNRGQIPLFTHSADAPVTLNADCMGGGSSMGTLALSIPREQWDGTIRQADSAHWHLRYRIGSNTPAFRTADLERLFPGVTAAEATQLLQPHLFPDPGSIRFLECTDPNCNSNVAPPNITRVDWSREACGDIIAGPFLAPITPEQRAQQTERNRAFLACLWFGAQTVYWESWNWPPPPIRVLENRSYTVRAVAMNITTRGTTLDWSNTVYVDQPGSHKFALVPTAPCNSSMRISVFRTFDADGVRQHSDWSRDYTVVNTNPCAVQVQVTFDSVRIGPFHHACFPFCPAEPSVPSTIQFYVARSGGRSDGTTLTQLSRFYSDPNDSRGIWLGAGTRNLAQEFFRQDVGLADSDPWRSSGSMVSFGRNNNQADVFLDNRTSNQGIVFSGKIWDRGFYPFAGVGIIGHQLSQFSYCRFSIQLDPRPLSEWASLDMPFNNRANGDPNYTDFCEYTGHIRGTTLAGYRF